MTQEEAKYILEHTVLSWSVSGSDAREAIQMAIKELERKKGKWIRHEYKINGYAHAKCECSICGEISPHTLLPLNFCPNCGAEME